MAPHSSRRNARPSVRASSKRAAKSPRQGRTQNKSTPTRRPSIKENSKAAKPRKGAFKIILRILIIAAIFCVVAIAACAAVYFQNDNAKYAAVEEYRPVVSQACDELGLGNEWTDCLLAAMFVESGGDSDVKSVLNVNGDIMQAAEGAYGWIVTDGWPEYGLEPETTEASIYAGVLEFKQNLELWEDYLGSIDPNDTTEIQLVIQGYNFGADGWMQWCESKGIKAYTVELAQTYSDTKMPANAKGTPSHAQKWLTAYNTIRSK